MDIEDIFSKTSNESYNVRKFENHNIFNKNYAENYYYSDIVKAVSDPEMFKVEIKDEILKLMRVVISESFNNVFKKHTDLTKFFRKLKQEKGKEYGVLSSLKKTILLAHYRYLIEKESLNRNYQMEKFLKLCAARSRSGVVSVTIFTSGDLLGQDGTRSKEQVIKTGGCPMNCHYCPFEKDENGIATQPRSYLSTEPGNMRATQNKHHPVGQVYDRIRQLESTGHISNNPDDISKIEAIISGATFPFYPKDYLIWFTTCMYYAYNTYYNWEEMRDMKTLDEEKAINEKASLRVIGLTIETRPDYVTPKTRDGTIDFSQLKLFRYLGVTRVQIGVQSTKDDILKKVNRKCTNEMNKIGIRRLKQNGFKTDIHIMFDLPGSTPDIDKEVVDEIVDDPDYQVDQWKCYPTVILNWTKIKQWYDEGSYLPYAEDNSEGIAYKLIDVLAYTMSRVPRYVRVNRVVRDFPSTSIEGGLKYTNARQLVKDKMEKDGVKCMDIRQREIKSSNIDTSDIKMNIIPFKSSSGMEYFISYTDVTGDILYGFVRLRLNQECEDVLDSIKGCALIRELHVYGEHTCVGKKIKHRTQHIGLGTSLLKKAEYIATSQGYQRIAVIAGVGVRDYYRKKGYQLGEDEYMFKELPDYFWFKLNENYGIGRETLIAIFIVFLAIVIFTFLEVFVPKSYKI